MTDQTILVVEDDRKIRTLLRRVLEDEGYAVQEAGGVDEALRLLAAGPVSLITLDLHLGRDSGIDLARQIRRGSAVPIVMVTGRDDVIDRVVGLEIGADDYITKPFHVREVVARIRSVLRRAGGAQPSVAGGAQPSVAGGAQPSVAGGAQPRAAGGAQTPLAVSAQTPLAGGAQPIVAAGPQTSAAAGPQTPAAADPQPRVAGGTTPRPPAAGPQDTAAAGAPFTTLALPPGPAFRFDGLTAIPDRMQLVGRDGADCPLTTGDVRLLAAFLVRPGRVLSRDQLMDLTGGAGWTPLDRTIDNQIARLRKKIERDPSHPRLIRTVRGVGYMLTCEVQTVQPSDLAPNSA